MTKPLNIGIIGLGRIGKLHLGNLRLNVDIGDINLCDAYESALRSYADNGSPTYTDYKSLIDDPLKAAEIAAMANESLKTKSSVV